MSESATMSALPAPPPIDDANYVYHFGFPIMDDAAFYRANVDPNWVSERGQEPNMSAALWYIKKATGIDRMTIDAVWVEEQLEEPMDILFVAIASAKKGMDREQIIKFTEEQLRLIAEQIHLPDVKPCWLRSVWWLEDLVEMDVQLVLDL